MQRLRVYDTSFSLLVEYVGPMPECREVAVDWFGLDYYRQGWSIQLLTELQDTPWEAGSGLENPPEVPWSRIYKLYDSSQSCSEARAGWFVFFERGE